MVTGRFISPRKPRAPSGSIPGMISALKPFSTGRKVTVSPTFAWMKAGSKALAPVEPLWTMAIS